MSFRLLSISSMYSGYLDSFYDKNPTVGQLSYSDHKRILLEDTIEFVGAYQKNFKRSGIEADCIICNDSNLQEKWGRERGMNPEKRHDILIDQVISYKPDVILVENLSYVTPAILDLFRRQIPELKLVAANHCSPFNSKVLEGMKGVDFVFTCTPGLKKTIEDLGKRSFLVYHGFDSDLLKKVKFPQDFPQNAFIFSGSLITGGDFHAKRIKLIERILKENIDIGLYVNLEANYRIRSKQAIYMLSKTLNALKMKGVAEKFQILKYGKTWADSYSHRLIKHKEAPVFGVDMLNLFGNSKIVLNFHIGIAGDFAGNMRMFEVTGVGSCLLTDNKKNMKDLFDTSQEVVVYDNEEDCVAKVKWLLDHEEERKRIALSGQQKTLKYHTVENRCSQIIDILNNELKLSGATK